MPTMHRPTFGTKVTVSSTMIKRHLLMTEEQGLDPAELVALESAFFEDGATILGRVTPLMEPHTLSKPIEGIYVGYRHATFTEGVVYQLHYKDEPDWMFPGKYGGNDKLLTTVTYEYWLVYTHPRKAPLRASPTHTEWLLPQEPGSIYLASSKPDTVIGTVVAIDGEKYMKITY